VWTPEQEADELARAELWRAQAQRRRQFQGWLWFTALAGDPRAAAQLYANWAAVIGMRLDDWTDPADDPEFDPFAISDHSNVGT
jgi:hypothetical protein